MRKAAQALVHLATAAAALLAAAGCSREQKKDIADAAEQTKAAARNFADDVKAAAIETWNNIRDLTLSRRSEYSQSVERLVGKLDANVARMRAETVQAGSPATDARARAVAEYEQARQGLRDSLAQLNTATLETWADAKANVKRAWDRVELAYEKCQDREAPQGR